MTLYLAGPIEGVSLDDATGWRLRAAEIAPAGCLLFDPVLAWHGVSQATASAVSYGDRVTIAHCDGVLAYLAGPGRAFGTIREIEWARSHGKPVAVVVGDDPLLSAFAHDVSQHRTLDEALDALLAAIREHQDRPVGMFVAFPFGAESVDEDG